MRIHILGEDTVVLYADVVKIFGELIQTYYYALVLQCLKNIAIYNQDLKGIFPHIEETLYLISINYTTISI